MEVIIIDLTDFNKNFLPISLYESIAKGIFNIIVPIPTGSPINW